MNRPQRPSAQDLPDPSIIPTVGWHCSHFYYRFNRGAVNAIDESQRERSRTELVAALALSESGPARMQTSIVSGHKADFGLMIMDPDPLVIEKANQDILNTCLGATLEATYSYVSLTEISEYVPTLEQYGDRLVEDGDEQGTPAYNAKLEAYEQREPIMRRQRLTPDFPEWPAMCFYPMNKKRKVGENWFMMDFVERNLLMSEHARSGRQFAGKVQQLITTSVGLDDWEWGVTLWARNPEYLKDIVYRMRFDEASARYAEFGPFYTSYICDPATMLEHCGI
ncbi:MAG: heme-dependent peroxidase [Planctomycetaceae bacterium]|nr:heme-dependent peroxidase [Planctomycetaceae bacterium]